QAENGGLRRLSWLFPVAAALFAAFAWWEVRLARRGRSPLLEPQLLTNIPGYPAGATIGLCYFAGFTGIWLVLALFLQRGLGCWLAPTTRTPPSPPRWPARWR